MNQVLLSLGWCWFQALFVSGLAVALSRLAARRSAVAAATAAWFGVVAVLLLLLFAFAPRPRFGRSFARRPPIAARAPVEESPHNRHSDAAAATDSDEGTAQAPLLAASLDALMTRLQKTENTIARSGSWTRWIASLAALGTIFGISRMAFGLTQLAHLRRSSRPVVDAAVADTLETLRQKLRLAQCPGVCETDSLTSAAVIGWRKPVVVLPATWREWTADELRVVLAHELAHIVRRDFVWRSVAALAVALYWLQPLVYVLRRQLVLAQELAADEVAAAAVGGKTVYLRALTQLALRQDSRPANGPAAAALLPVFSGFLLRRMAMLRAMDGSLSGRSRRLVQGSVIGAIAAALLLATAVRGLAEPPEEAPDGSVRVARANKIVPPAADNTANADSKFFQHPPLDLATIPLNRVDTGVERGGAVIRLGEIFRQPRFAGLVSLADAAIAASWQETFAGAQAPEWSLANIEYVAGDFDFSARYQPEPRKPDQTAHQIMFGSSGCMIRWQKPVAPIFEALRRVPDAKVKEHGDYAYVCLHVPAFGPADLCVCQLDERTLLWTGGEDVFLKRLDRLAQSPQSPKWLSAWENVEGGLVTLVAAKADYKSPADVELPEDEQLTKLLLTTPQTMAVGVDWSPTEGEDVALKLQVRFADQDSAQNWKSALQTMIDRATAEIAAGLNDEGVDSKQIFGSQALLHILQHSRMATREAGDGWQLDAEFKGPLELRPFWAP
jgi:beta-lactamase regulating signal transducer with metallopeptidase domain